MLVGVQDGGRPTTRQISALRRAASLALLGPLLLLSMPARALASDTPHESLQAWNGQLQAADTLASACAAQAARCDPERSPADAVVEGAPGGPFFANWRWMGEALEEAHRLADSPRRAGMRSVHEQLQVLALEAGQDLALPAPKFARARGAANKVLASPEFHAVTSPSWTSRQLARLQAWLFRLFFGLNRLGNAAPWLVPLVEWGCFALALAGLLLFARRSLSRQALQLRFAHDAAPGTVRGHDADAWRRLAREHADRAEWRDALHCLYWSTVASLEARRAWKPNPTRTPREYLALLRPGSEAYTALQSLTRDLERGWYGAQPVDETRFHAAEAKAAAAEVARVERAGTDGNGTNPSTTTTPALAGGGS